MSAEAKARILAEIERRYWSDPEYLADARRSLGKLRPAWFDIAEETAADREHASVMRTLRDLLEASAEQSTRRAAAAEAELVARRREHLSLVSDPTPTDPDEGA
jgi:hypothetical protein